MYITSPQKFAAWFNEKYPGAYRRITTKDVEDMTTCGLIGLYRYYSPPQDGETIRGILQYEQLREKRFEQDSIEDKFEPSKCRMCGQPLLPELLEPLPWFLIVTKDADVVTTSSSRLGHNIRILFPFKIAVNTPTSNQILSSL